MINWEEYLKRQSVELVQFSKLVDNVIKSPTHSGKLQRGRSYVYDSPTNTLVIKDPNHIDGGTVFRPDKGLDYVKNLK